MSFPMPRHLAEEAERYGRQSWVAILPTIVDSLREHWSLDLGEPSQPGGRTAWVAPARDAAGEDLVLKVAWRHAEAEHEAEGLRCWAGNGAVRVHDVQHLDDTMALLLERCDPGTPLTNMPEREQDTIIADLLRRLWVQPPTGHPFRPLQQMCDTWADALEAKAVSAVVVDPGLARDGMALMRGLPASADRSVLLCTDLHAENVLAARREPWLVIDPKPYVGDPTYDPLQHILNCRDRLCADPRALALRMADLLELDGERLLLWLFARCVQQAPSWPWLADVARRIAPG